MPFGSFFGGCVLWPKKTKNMLFRFKVKQNIKIFLHLGIFNAERDPFLLQESGLRANKHAVSRIPTHHLYPPTISIKCRCHKNGFWLGRGCPFVLRCVCCIFFEQADPPVECISTYLIRSSLLIVSASWHIKIGININVATVRFELNLSSVKQLIGISINNLYIATVKNIGLSYTK